MAEFRFFHLIWVVLLVAFAIPERAVGETISKPTVETLTDYFDTVVFGTINKQDGYSTTLAKRTLPVFYTIKGDASSDQIDILSKYISFISRLVNLKIKKVDELDASENMTVIFLPAEHMSKIHFTSVAPERIHSIASPKSCYFLFTKDSEDTINRSFIVINKDRRIEQTRHCILEELLQSLGFPNDTDMLRPSIFSAADSLTSITRNDEIIVRSLYDNSLIPGMERRKVLSLVKGIIADWDARLPIP